jgi:hypothetical protein
MVLVAEFEGKGQRGKGAEGKTVSKTTCNGKIEQVKARGKGAKGQRGRGKHPLCSFVTFFFVTLLLCNLPLNFAPRLHPFVPLPLCSFAPLSLCPFAPVFN